MISETLKNRFSAQFLGITVTDGLFLAHISCTRFARFTMSALHGC